MNRILKFFLSQVLLNNPCLENTVPVNHPVHMQEGAAMPLVATGLLQHEAKLSVLNFGIKKAAAYDGAVANKDELLFVSGVRCGAAKPYLQPSPWPNASCRL